MSVSIQFDYAAEDLAEASAAGIRRMKKGTVFGRGLAGCIVFAALAALMIYRGTQGPNTPASAPRVPLRSNAANSDVNPQLIAWLIILGVVIALLFIRYLRGKKRLTGAEGTRWLTADERHVAFADALSRTEYKWEAFSDVEETAALFILYQKRRRKSDPIQMIAVPKRAFQTTDSAIKFRLLLDAYIQPSSSGFPVVPLPARDGD